MSDEKLSLIRACLREKDQEKARGLLKQACPTATNEVIDQAIAQMFSDLNDTPKMVHSLGEGND